MEHFMTLVKLFVDQGLILRIDGVEDDVKAFVRMEVSSKGSIRGIFFFDPDTYDMLSGSQVDRLKNKK